jgi:hypothetical protein
VKIDITNTGSRPILLKDLFIEAHSERGRRIYYEPIMLFDLTHYYASTGQAGRIATTPKGMVPLPIAIPAGKHIDFGHEMRPPGRLIHSPCCDTGIPSLPLAISAHIKYNRSVIARRGSKLLLFLSVIRSAPWRCSHAKHP